MKRASVRRGYSAGSLVFFAFAAGSALSLLPLCPEWTQSRLLAALVLCPALAALPALSLGGRLLILLLGVVSGFCAPRYIAAAGLSCLPLMCVLMPLMFIAAGSGMELSREIKERCSGAGFRAACRRDKILLYLSAAGSLISAYIIFR